MATLYELDIKPNVPTQEEIAAFEQPEVRVGQIVLFYRYGQRGRSPQMAPYLGFVQKVNRRTIEVYTTTGQRFDGVRHLADPKLRLEQAEHRENGAWDYTDQDRQEAQWKVMVEESLQAVDDGGAEKPKRGKKGDKPDATVKFQKLLLECCERLDIIEKFLAQAFSEDAERTVVEEHPEQT